VFVNAGNLMSLVYGTLVDFMHTQINNDVSLRVVIINP
jgi:hypothetical protein